MDFKVLHLCLCSFWICCFYYNIKIQGWFCSNMASAKFLATSWVSPSNFSISKKNFADGQVDLVFSALSFCIWNIFLMLNFMNHFCHSASLQSDKLWFNTFGMLSGRCTLKFNVSWITLGHLIVLSKEKTKNHILIETSNYNLTSINEKFQSCWKDDECIKNCKYL